MGEPQKGGEAGSDGETTTAAPFAKALRLLRVSEDEESWRWMDGWIDRSMETETQTESADTEIVANSEALAFSAFFYSF